MFRIYVSPVFVNARPLFSHNSHVAPQIFFTYRKTETIPQTVIQVVALLMTEPAQRETIQFISLSISLLSAGYAVASTDRALDMGKTRRRTDPHLFGYVPSVADGAFWQLFAMVVFFASYMVAKMFALAVLVTAGGAWLGAFWL